MDVREENILGNSVWTHWYYLSKAHAVLRLLRKTKLGKLIDIGAGSGFFSKFILDNTEATDAQCIDIEYQREREEVRGGKRICFLRQPRDVEQGDVFLVMDVLEHIDDDVGFLADYVRRARPGARFMITVPAFQFLWSSHDVFLQHRRRYTVRAIESVAERSGLAVERSSYFFCLLFPIVALVRLTQRMRSQRLTAQSDLQPLHPLVNRILYWLCRLECSTFARANRLMGVTAMCLAIKR